MFYTTEENSDVRTTIATSMNFHYSLESKLPKNAYLYLEKLIEEAYEYANKGDDDSAAKRYNEYSIKKEKLLEYHRIQREKISQPRLY